MAAAAAALTVDECMWCTSETRHQAARRFIVISSIKFKSEKNTIQVTDGYIWVGVTSVPTFKLTI